MKQVLFVPSILTQDVVAMPMVTSRESRSPTGGFVSSSGNRTAMQQPESCFRNAYSTTWYAMFASPPLRLRLPGYIEFVPGNQYLANINLKPHINGRSTSRHLPHCKFALF